MEIVSFSSRWDWLGRGTRESLRPCPLLLTTKATERLVTMETEATMQPTRLPETAPPAARMKGESWPDWTPEQKAILGLIAERYKQGQQIRWSKAFKENPEWEPILLQGGRPINHLWYIAGALARGTVPDNARQHKLNEQKAYYQKVKKSKADASPKSHKRGKSWWAKQGLPHPASREAKAARLKAQTENGGFIAHPEQVTPALATQPIRHCPDCGLNLEPYNRAKQLMEAHHG